MKIVLDLETNGLPQMNGYSFPNSSDFKKYDTSRIVQIGYIILNNNNEIIARKSLLINPNNRFQITNSHIHGITEDIAVKYGLDIDDALRILEFDVKECKLLICHNVSFDKNVLLSELYRSNKFSSLLINILRLPVYCTMEKGKEKFALKKFPKLTELVKLVSPQSVWIQKHDALDDCDHCLKCYVALTIK